MGALAYSPSRKPVPTRQSTNASTPDSSTSTPAKATHPTQRRTDGFPASATISPSTSAGIAAKCVVSCATASVHPARTGCSGKRCVSTSSRSRRVTSPSSATTASPTPAPTPQAGWSCGTGADISDATRPPPGSIPLPLPKARHPEHTDVHQVNNCV